MMVLNRLHATVEQVMQEKRLQKEIFRTLIILLFFMLVAGGMVVGQIASDRLFDRYVRKVNVTVSDMIIKATTANTSTSHDFGQLDDEQNAYAMEPLRDVVFQILPNWSVWRGWLPDALLLPLVIGCFLINVLWRQEKVLKYQGWIVLRRYLVILTILYVFRTITFIVTTVPSPMDDCLPMYVRTDDDKEALHKYLILFGRMASGKVTACTDNIYSGHTTLITVSVWCYIQYSGAIALKIYALLHGLAALLAILICRLHYTVDVVIAMIVASFVYVTIHYLIQFAMDELYMDTSRKQDSNDPSNISVGAVQVEKILLKRISFRGILKAISWIDGMDLRLRKFEND